MSSAKRKPIRVFVGPVEISGIAEGLVEGLRASQANAQVVFSFAHPFKYGDHSRSWIVDIWQRIGALRSATTRDNLIRKSLLVVAHNLWGWLVFMHNFSRFDAFIFLFGQTFTDTAFELWLLKKLGKKIIFVYVGSDARPPYMDGGLFPGGVNDDLPCPQTLLKSVQRCKAKIRLHERYANYLINSPAAAHFHERPYINWFSLGIPKQLPEIPNIARLNTDEHETIRVLHAPSHPLVKGTSEIIEMFDRLRRKGHAIELIKIQGIPNEIVLQELSRCDFIVDQLFADTPMAAFATEAALFGKPAVVGGYFAGMIDEFLDKADVPPSLYVEPQDIEMAIERLILDKEFRLQLGEQARHFVLTRWSPKDVAGRYLQLLNDEIPSDWWCDPAKVRYLSGCGLPKGRSKRLVRLLLKHFGSRSLQVEGKPQLERDLMEFASLAETSADA